MTKQIISSLLQIEEAYFNYTKEKKKFDLPRLRRKNPTMFNEFKIIIKGLLEEIKFVLKYDREIVREALKGEKNTKELLKIYDSLLNYESVLLKDRGLINSFA